MKALIGSEYGTENGSLPCCDGRVWSDLTNRIRYVGIDPCGTRARIGVRPGTGFSPIKSPYHFVAFVINVLLVINTRRRVAVAQDDPVRKRAKQ